MLINHFIKELIRSIGSAFCGNPRLAFPWISGKSRKCGVKVIWVGRVVRVNARPMSRITRSRCQDYAKPMSRYSDADVKKVLMRRTLLA